MAELKEPVVQVFHGEDSAGFNNTVRANVADQSSQVVGEHIDIKDTTPAQDGEVLDPSLIGEHANKADHLQELTETTTALIKGDSDAPSRGFLAKLKARILKQHPGASIKEVS